MMMIMATMTATREPIQRQRRELRTRALADTMPDRSVSISAPPPPPPSALDIRVSPSKSPYWNSRRPRDMNSMSGLCVSGEKEVLGTISDARRRSARVISRHKFRWCRPASSHHWARRRPEKRRKKVRYIITITSYHWSMLSVNNKEKITINQWIFFLRVLLSLLIFLSVIKAFSDLEIFLVIVSKSFRYS